MRLGREVDSRAQFGIGMPDVRPAGGHSADRLTRTPADVQAILLDVARATASHRDLATLLRDLVDVLHRVARFDRVALVLHDPTRDVMRLHSVAAFHPTPGTLAELPIADTPAGVAWETQQPIVAPDLDRETRFPVVTGILRGEGMMSSCTLPLTSPLRRLGALIFASREEDAFGPPDVEL